MKTVLRIRSGFATRLAHRHRHICPSHVVTQLPEAAPILPDLFVTQTLAA
jgi:hypothetical protein